MSGRYVYLANAAEDHGVDFLFLNRQTHDVLFGVLAVADHLFFVRPYVLDAGLAGRKPRLHFADRQDYVIAHAARLILRDSPVRSHLHDQLV